MLMSYAFITTGDGLFVVPDGFDRGDTRSLKANREAITVPNPAQGHLTNDMDRPVIESLTRAAESSQAFSCWRVFVKESTQSCRICVLRQRLLLLPVLWTLCIGGLAHRAPRAIQGREGGAGRRRGRAHERADGPRGAPRGAGLDSGV